MERERGRERVKIVKEKNRRPVSIEIDWKPRGILRSISLSLSLVFPFPLRFSVARIDRREYRLDGILCH